MRRFKKWLYATAILLCIGFPLGILAINGMIKSTTAKRIYDSTDNLPEVDVALVLGTSPKLVDGARNLFFEFRMDAAAELFKSGKIKHLLVSGANPSIHYNEPDAMRDALVKRDVPFDAITLDYAGLRTLDSIVRAKHIFGQDRLIIVTQEFHLHRSLYLADHEGIDAVGFEATKVPFNYAKRVYWRELLARVKAFIDLNITDKEPRFMGDPEPIQLEPESST